MTLFRGLRHFIGQPNKATSCLNAKSRSLCLGWSQNEEKTLRDIDCNVIYMLHDSSCLLLRSLFLKEIFGCSAFFMKDAISVATKDKIYQGKKEITGSKLVRHVKILRESCTSVYID